MILRGGAVLAAALLAFGCSTTTPRQDYLSYRGGEAPAPIAARLAQQVGSCWFAEDERAFAGHLYVPEFDTGRPRILIVRTSEPTGLPRLVLQATEQGGGSEVRLFGPMMGEPQGARIERDVARWVGGARGC